MLGYDVTSALAEINLPTLVVTGNQDMTTKPEAGEFINSQVPQSRLSSLVPAKHLGFFEHYDRFNQWLDQFASTVFDSSNDATGPAGVR